MTRRRVRIQVNGNWVEREITPDHILLDFLREDLGLTGTKKGCEEGECGACTILLDGKAVLSCIMPAVKADGAEILTVEGLAEMDGLHPIQQAFWEEGAVQCGYCTPGMLLSAKALLDENSTPTTEEVKEAISGNLCRCTGYGRILRAIQVASERMRREKNSRSIVIF